MGKVITMSEKTITLDEVIVDINDAMQKLDNFAASTRETADQVVTARLTQAVVLGGTAFEILSGLNAGIKAAAAANAAASVEDAEPEA